MRGSFALMALVAATSTMAVNWPSIAQEAPRWRYEGPTGPAYWAKEYPACAGRSQSPIDVRTTKKVSEHPIEFHYEASRLRVVNTGHTVMVNYDEGSFVTLDGAQYQLTQFHFHRPSEERIHGRAYPFEAHLVHQGGNGELAVVAVLFQKGAGHPLVDAIWRHLPTAIGQEATVAETRINANDLLPKAHTYYRYSGSLTTPPCTEGVQWSILTTPRTLSAQQLNQFPFKMNARPVQPLNGRSIEQD